VIPVRGLPEVREGDDLAELIAAAADLEDGDVVVVAHKVVSKAEGRVVRLAEVEPSAQARDLAAARRIVSDALRLLAVAVVSNPQWRTDLERRQQRLERRLGRNESPALALTG